jgi:glycerol uptake facilitator-like aquaporin
MGSILASGTLALVLDVTPDAYFGTVPVGSNSQALVLEMISSFLLMFVISGVTTDSRAVCNPQIPQNFFSYVKNFIVCWALEHLKNLCYISLFFIFSDEKDMVKIYVKPVLFFFFLQRSELAGVAVGMTILLNVFVAG